MDDTPSTINQAASTANSILSGVLQGMGEPAIEAACITAEPWLGWIGIKQLLLEPILKLVIGETYKVTAKQITGMIIDIQINGEKSAVNQALQAEQAANASGDPNAIKQATQTWESAFGSLAHYDGSASP